MEVNVNSFGFRPGRSQHDALKPAKSCVQDGCRHIVDMDLAKFFDTVQLDRLMSRLATRVYDRRVLKLVRSFLTAGVMTFGLVSTSIEEAPQGGPFSPRTPMGGSSPSSSIAEKSSRQRSQRCWADKEPQHQTHEGLSQPVAPVRPAFRFSFHNPGAC